MAEKKTTKKAAAPKAEEPKKTTVKKAAAPKKAAEKKAFVVNAENAGFKAGDVYQALAAAEKALSVKEIAKAAKISEEELCSVWVGSSRRVSSLQLTRRLHLLNHI